MGRDGIVRARRFQQQSEIGQDLSDSPMFVRLDREPVGHHEVIGSIDSLRRFASYRALPDLPLIVAVSNLASSALAPSRRRAAEYRLSAVIFTLFVAIFCLVLIRAERRTRRDNASLSAELAERRKAEEALHESEGLFAAFLDHIPAVVFVQDLQGRTLYSNQAYKDIPGREAIGMNARDLLAPGQDGPPGSRPALRGRSVVLDETISDGDGRARIFETRMFVVDRAGKDPLLGCVSVDTTGRRHAEEERLVFERRMQQAQKLESLGVLAGGIAHDFNNLLMVILGNADLALAKSAAESPVIGFIRNIDTAAQRAADLANQMLAYSGKGRFLIEPINLSRLVEEMGHLLGSVISKRATVRYRLAGELPAVQADATQMRQVVMNLITNASDAIGDRQGVIEIATGVVEIGPPGSGGRLRPRPAAGDVRVPRGLRHRRAEWTRRRRPSSSTPSTPPSRPGAGWAWPPCSGSSGGTAARSGSTATPGRAPPSRCCCRRLPTGRRPVPPPAVSPRRDQGPGVDGTPILLVDDEEHVLQTTRAMLEENGFAVITAADGVEGVEIVPAAGRAPERGGARHEHAAHGRRGGVPADAPHRPRRAGDPHQRLRRTGRRQRIHRRGPRGFHPEAVPDEGAPPEDRGRDRRETIAPGLASTATEARHMCRLFTAFLFGALIVAMTGPTGVRGAESGDGEAHFAALRDRMVTEQIQARDVSDRRVLAALRKVPRPVSCWSSIALRPTPTTRSRSASADELTAVHRRDHVGSDGAHRGRAGPRGRHRLGLPAAVLAERREKRRVPSRSSHPWRAGRPPRARSSGMATSSCAPGTATSAGPERRPSTRSS